MPEKLSENADNVQHKPEPEIKSYESSKILLVTRVRVSQEPVDDEALQSNGYNTLRTKSERIILHTLIYR